MRAGELRHRVEIQAATITRDTLGQGIKTWATVLSVWASISPVSGTEKNADATLKQIKNERGYKITARYNATITPQHRIKWGSRRFDINAVLNIDERSREITLSATEAI